MRGMWKPYLCLVRIANDRGAVKTVGIVPESVAHGETESYKFVVSCEIHANMPSDRLGDR